MDEEKITILFLVLVSLVIFIFGGSIIIFALKKEKKKKEELIDRCTISVQGMLVGIAQSYSSHVGDDSYDDYSYNPIVRYDFGGQTYEKTYNSTFTWKGIQSEQLITIFVNPNNVEEIYVPLPEGVKENRNKNAKIFIIIFLIWILVGFIGSILMGK